MPVLVRGRPLVQRGIRVTTGTTTAARKRDARTARRETRIRAAAGSTIPGAVASAVVRSGLGRRVIQQAGAALRQTPLSRFIGRPASTLVGPAGQALALTKGRPGLVRQAVKIGGRALAVGGAFEAGTQLFERFGPQIESLQRGLEFVRGEQMARRGRAPAQRGLQGVGFQPGTIVPPDSITHSWVANGVPFAQLADGRVMVRRKNGTIKIFRRPKPIVLGRNPGVKDLVRADKKITALLKLVQKRLPPARRPKATPARHDTITQVRAG